MKFKRGEIGGATSPTVPMHYGVGGGYGRGRGRGMGMGMRYGMGMSQQTAYPAAIPPAPQMTKEQEIQMLKDQMKMLQKQLENIKKRLKELKE